MAAQRLGAARVLGALELSSFAVVIFAFFVVGAGVGLGVAGLGPGPGSGSPGAARGHLSTQCALYHHIPEVRALPGPDFLHVAI